MIRTIPTGDLGLDVLLGGGWRLVERLPGRESATVVISGGPGTGKTLLSVDVALALAAALKGDVAVGCVELLPSEYRAQIEAGRGELVLQWRDGPSLPEQRVVVLQATIPVASSQGPRIFCGLLGDLDPSAPDLVGALEALRRDVQALHGNPVVFVVDSLIGGYGLGPTTPRLNVDALMKFAARDGVGLVLCEETTDSVPSQWEFSADTVLALENNRAANGRQILVRKHRYGPSAHGAHQLEILGWRQPRVAPRVDAWLGGHRMATTLRTHGWRFVNDHGFPPLRWIDALAPAPLRPREFACALAVIAGPNLEIARKLAFGLVPANAESNRDIVIELDPLGSDRDGWTSSNVDIHYIRTAMGADAALCELVEYLGGHLFPKEAAQRPRRIVIGDVATVVSLTDHAAWAEIIRVIAELVTSSGCGIPVIAYDSSRIKESGTGGLAALRRHAELVVELSHVTSTVVGGHATSRPDGTFESFHFSRSALIGKWPQEIAHLGQLPRPSGRSVLSKIKKADSPS